IGWTASPTRKAIDEATGYRARAHTPACSRARNVPLALVAPYLKALRCQALCCSTFPLALFPGACSVGAHTSCRDTLRLEAPPLRPPPCLGTLPALADPRIAPFRRSHISAV